MKCDNCGSTAQIKLTNTETEGNTIVQTYTCGCGAIKKRIFIMTKEFTITPWGTYLHGRA